MAIKNKRALAEKKHALDQNSDTFCLVNQNRDPYLGDNIRQKVFQHIRKNAKEKGIHIDFINGYVEHVHCLVSLGSDHNIEKVMQLIPYWKNKNKLCNARFEWQDEYFAVSLSDSGRASSHK